MAASDTPIQQPEQSPSVQVTEFGGTSRIDSAAADIRGRYPATGSSVNQVSDMVIRVSAGSGTIVVAGKSHAVAAGSVLTIERSVPYYYEPGAEGLNIFMVSTPPWSSDQYQTVA